MFGGLAFSSRQHGRQRERPGRSALRVDPVQTTPGQRGTRTRFVMRGREMDGWLRIDTDAIETDDELRVDKPWRHVRQSLPPK